MGVVVAHQDIADLNRVSPEFASRLMNSTSSFFGFLQKLPDSADLISGISGTFKTKVTTDQLEEHLQKSSIHRLIKRSLKKLGFCESRSTHN